MNESKRLAVDLLYKYKLAKPTLDDVLFIVQEQGYEIIDYDPTDNTELFRSLKLTQQVTNQDAFLYTDNEVRLLFLRDNLETDEKRFAAAHELGHIVFKHTSAVSRAIEEYEASEFAHYLLNPSKEMRVLNAVRRRKWVSAIIALLVVTLVLGASLAWKNHLNSKYSDYYATANGTKYHRMNCLMVKDKTNLHRLTKDELTGGGYEACSLCLGGDVIP